MQNIMSSSYLRRNVPMLIRKLRCILVLLAVSNFLLAESFLRSKLPSSQFEGEKSSNLCKNKSSILTERLSVQEKEFASRSLICRRSTCLYGLDLFGLGAPEIVICGLAVAVLYGPDRIKGQLKDNGVKGQIVAEGWREEHNERIADVKKYAVQSRKKRAWKKINIAIENEDPIMLAKLALVDAKNPETVKSISASMEDEETDDDYDDDDAEDDELEIVV
jgi:hypothetical protein